jgi:hypothetical protein
MVVGEFTASAIGMEEDKREQEAQEKKDAAVDYSKLEADIAANKTLAAQVRRLPTTACNETPLPLHCLICLSQTLCSRWRRILRGVFYLLSAVSRSDSLPLRRVSPDGLRESGVVRVALHDVGVC